MSIRIMNMVWGIEGLYSTDKLVLLALADNANNDGMCWPAVTDIARRCGLKVRQTINVIKKLVEAGYISREDRAGKSTVFRFQTPATGCTPTPAMECTPANIAPLQSSVSTPATGCTPTPAISDIPPTPPYRAEPSFEPSRTIKHIRPKEAGPPCGNKFSDFWEVYPRKVKKQTAQEAYGKAIKNGATDEQIIGGAIAYAAHVAAEGTEAQYIAHPTTWLNGKRWEDEFTTVQFAKPEKLSKTGESLAALHRAGNRAGTGGAVEPGGVFGEGGDFGYPAPAVGGRT